MDLICQAIDMLYRYMVYSRDDGWWKVRDEKDNIGTVPSNFLQPYEEDLEDETESILNEDTGMFDQL